MSSKTLQEQALNLLRQLIKTPSFSNEEAGTAAILAAFFEQHGIPVKRKANNIWAMNRYWRAEAPILLLNSHHDTVKPVPGWSKDPFEPLIEKGHLYGLGSNDAGASLVALAAAFLCFYPRKDLPFNIIMAATAEEEISGRGGVASVLEEWPPIWCGIVGEPTSLRMAIAERGLMVIDAETRGQAGHAARKEGINALYLAIDDINTLRQCQFEKVSTLLGPVSLAVTQMEAGTQHNVVPDRCSFVIDVRSNEHYTHAEVLAFLQAKAPNSKLSPRSMRLSSSGIAEEHPLVKSGITIGLEPFGSLTLSDQALMPFDTIKLGPGDSARSHTADEYILVSEIEQGITTYIQFIEQLALLI